MDFKHIISDLVHAELGVDKARILSIIEIPPDSKLGDYSMPCFMFSKELKKSPQNIALELKDKLTKINLHEDHKHFELINNVGPYLNFFVNKEVYMKNVLHKIFVAKDEYGKGSPKEEKVMIEHGQANTHKEFHVGHLRNVCLGDSLVRIYRFNGYNVISANYPGDIGTHVAKTLWYYLKYHKNDALPLNKGKFLGKLYSEASILLEDNPDVESKKEVSEILQKLENHDPEIYKLWVETRKWSLDQMEEIFKDLNVEYDVFFFESQVEKDGKKIAKILTDKNLAFENEGALIIDLKEYKLDVFLILKSDGTSLYSTKDLALALKKFNEYNIDKSYYVVDSRQSMYFQQLFKTLEIMGFHKDMHHIAYDFVTTKNGAMSSRLGNVILYEELKEKVTQKIFDETRQRHPTWGDEKIWNNSHKIMLAALKFGMLKIDNNRIIVFDMEDWLKFDGETGPYLLYSYARINSIFKKYAENKNTDFNLEELIKKLGKIDIALLTEKNEFEIVKHLERFSLIIEQSAKDFKPSLIARYLIELTQMFNEFYHANQILNTENAEQTMSRLYLIYNIRTVLGNGLGLLGIDTVEEM